MNLNLRSVRLRYSLAGCLLLAVVLPTCWVAASSLLWDFSDPGDYTISDPASLEIVGGTVRLVALDATDDDGGPSGFGGGTFVNTHWDATGARVELDSGLAAGDFTSRVLDAGQTATWSSFSWVPLRPHLKALPDNAAAETAYAEGNVDMGGNVLLLHLDETGGPLVDSSGQSNDGTATGGVVYAATGKLASGLELDGIDDRIDCGDDASLAPTDAITVAAWLHDEGGGRVVGDIAASALDTLEFDASAGATPSFVHVSGDIYAVAYTGPDGDGFVTSIDISSAGDIAASTIDTLEFDTILGVEPSMIHVSGTTYAVAYTGPGSTGFLKTFTIDGAGSISNLAIDAMQYDAGAGLTVEIFQVSSDVFGIAYEGASGKGVVTTVQISTIGLITDTALDTLDFDATAGTEPAVLAIAGDVYAIVYRDASDDAVLKTVEITAAGAITDTVIDTQIVDADAGFEPDLAHVAGDVFVVASRRSAPATGYLHTVEITASGLITDTVIDQQGLGIDVEAPELLAVSRDVFAIAFESGGEGLLNTYRIDAAGTITATAIDSRTFDSGGGGAPSILAVAGNAYAVAYSGTGGRGVLKSLDVVTHRGIFKGAAYGIDAVESRAVAMLNGVEIYAPISAGFQHVVLTYDRNAGSDQLALYVNGSLAQQATLTSPIATVPEALVIGEFFDGVVDEVAVFNRALSAAEIADHHERGAVRLRFQVRSGSSNPPAGSFVGPDGTTATFYSELSSATVGLPSLSITNLADDRYFQYRATFETDDVAITAALSSVQVGPDHYPADYPSIVNDTGVAFATLQAFSDTPGAGNAGDITYQISNNGADWYWWNGSAWTAASGGAQSNPATEVNSHAAAFHSDVGAGTFYFKAFLHSDVAENPVELDAVTLVSGLDVDLAVTHVVNDSTPVEGQSITYTVTLSNLGPDDATGVELTDLLPAGVTFSSATPTQGTYSNGSGIWTVGSIADGGSATLALAATVDAGTAGTTIVNTATLTGVEENDIAAGNDASSAPITVESADLEVGKTVDLATPNEGDTVTYTVTLSNHGPDGASAVEVIDLLPSGLTFVSATPSQGTYSSGTGVWNVGSVADAGVETLTLVATVDSGTATTTIVSSAAINNVDQTDPVGGNNSDSAAITVLGADLTLTKGVDDATPEEGDTITYTVTLSNAGPDSATSITVNDLLPAGVNFTSATPSQGSYASGSGDWSVGTVAASGGATLTIVATIDAGTAGTTIINTATVSSVDEGDPSSGDESDSVPIDVVGADLSVTKVVSNGTPRVGDSVTYTVTLANGGPDDAGGIEVTDLLPAGVTFTSATPSQGSYVHGTGVWTVGSVADSGSATLSIVATVDAATAGQTIVNTATITAVAEDDPDPGNDSDTASITVGSSDLAVTKVVDEALPDEGDTVSYTITLDNNGPDAAAGIEVTDLLPAGVTFVSATPSQGSYVSGTGVWSAGSIAASGSATLTLVATVDAGTAGQTITNTATVTTSDQEDPVGGNDSSAVPIDVPSSDLSVTAGVNRPTPNEGDSLTYTITLSNLGPDDATGVEVTDLLPGGVTFTSATPSQGSYSSGSGIWTVGSVSASGGATLTIDATVDAGTGGQTIINTATITDSDRGDPVSGNDTDTAPITVTEVDLSVAMTVNDASPDEGDTLTYTVTVSNAGPDDATNIEITDLLPSGLTYASDTPSQGAYASGSGVWIVGAISAAGNATLTLTATVDAGTAGATITNTATVTQVDQGDSAAGNDSDAAPVTVRSVDLQVAKSVDDASPIEGATVTYTVTVDNLGPDDATGVEVTDLLPAGVAFISATPSQGSYVSGSGVWTVGTIVDSGSATLTIDATVDGGTAGTTIINTASVTGVDQADPTSGNDSDTAPITVEIIDLQVTKTVDDASPDEGDTVIYTVTAANLGPDGGTGIELTDLLPAGVSFVSATPSQGSYVSGSGVWTVGSIAASGNATLTLTATVDSSTAGQTIINTATITASDQTDGTPGNDSDTAGIVVTAVDLSVVKTASTASPNEGETLTYTVTVTNLGPDDGTGIEVTDSLPAGVTFVSATPSQGSYASGTGVWTVGSISASASATLTIDVTVDAGTAGQTIVNTASVTALVEGDPVSGNDSDGASVTVKSADLQLTKTVDDATPDEGDTITYTVTVTSAGPDDATNVQATDVLPAGITFVSATPSQGTYNTGTGVWNIGPLSASGAETLTLVATVNGGTAGTTIVNTATITSTDQGDPSTGDESDSASITVQAADLDVTKTVDDATPNEGDTVTYTVTLSNSGPDGATNVTLTDLLPSGLSFSSATPSQGSYVSGSGVWTVGSVANAGNATLTLVATVDGGSAGTTIVNTASISASDQGDPVSGNDSDSASITVSSAEVSVTNTVDEAAPDEGDTVTYTVTVSNAGPDDATGVEVTDLLPGGLSFSSATPSQGSYVSGTGVWTVGSVSASASATLTLAATVDAATGGDTIFNTATLTAIDQGGGDPGDDSETVAITIKSANLRVRKNVDNGEPNEGETVTYTVNVRNLGPDQATGVEVTDLLPAGVTFSSATPEQGTYVSGTGVWTVGTINVNTTKTLTLVATVDAGTSGTTIVNTASVTDSDRADPAAGNDSDSASITIPGADLAVTKTVNDATPAEGDTVTYTITVTNNGPDGATGIQVTDLLPAGVTFAGASPSQGTYAFQTGIWAVGAVLASETAVLTLTATVDSGTSGTNINNTAGITAADQVDSVSGNNSDGAAIDVLEIDMSVTKTVDDANPNEGDTVTYTVTVTNGGGADVTGIELTDALPTGVTFVSDAPSQGSYVNGTGVWTVGAILDGASATLTLVATVDSGTSATTIVNTATITAMDQSDPSAGNDSDTASITVESADLEVTKTVDDATPDEGDTVTYTVTVTNNGPDDATGVEVADLLPSGVTFSSATPSQGSYVSGTGVWTVGAISSAGNATLTIDATVDSGTAGTTVNNTASISASDQVDPTAGNDSDSVGITVGDADLAVTKSVDDAAPDEGDTITYTVTVTNNGPQDATGIEVTDLLPAGLTFSSATPSQGSYVNGTGVWTVGSISNAGNATLTIDATVDASTAGTTFSHAAAVTAADQGDATAGNNSDSAPVTVTSVDLAITKTVDDATPLENDTITYTVTVTNNGPDDATSVEVTDLLPAGVTYVSDTPSQGSYVNGTGVWTVGSISSSGNATMTIDATVDSGTGGTTIVNTASVTAAGQGDPVNGNDSDSASIVVDSVDLAVTKSVDDATPRTGNTITYTVTVTNNGPDDATSVEITDLLPAGVTYVSDTPGQGSYVNGTGVWTVGSISSSGNATLTIDATVDGGTDGTTIVNTASVTGLDQPDPVAGNDSDTASITVEGAELAVTKTVDDATPNEGDTVTYTVTVTNNGPEDATSVAVTDLLPSGVTYVSDTPSQGSYVSGSGVWTVGSLSSTSSATLTIDATVDSGTGTTTIVNSAGVTGVDQGDPVSGNNSDSASITVESADLAVTKTVSDANPDPLDTITYTVTVSNGGPDAANNVQVTDLLPAGVTYVSDTPSQGSYVNGTGVWTVGTIADAGSATLTIDATVDSGTSGQTITNTATITGADQADPASGNNLDSAPITVDTADLEVTKYVDDGTPVESQSITYTIQVTNLGPDTATGVEVTDLLPAGVAYASDTPSQGSYVNGTGVWTVGSLAMNTTATLTVTATVDTGTGGSTITNTASVTDLDQTDPVSGNDLATADISVEGAMRIASGTYTGDGTDGRAITGLGFQPHVVLIKADAASTAVIRTASMSGDATKSLGAATALATNQIESLDADGFTAGSDATVNASSTTYHWIAFEASPTELGYGTYTGDGSDDRSVTLPEFQPGYVMILGAGAQAAVHRPASLGGDATLSFDGTAAAADRIQALESLGFEIGADATVNQASATYHWIAWKAIAGRVATGSYTGDGTDDRDITSVGFRPDWLLVKSEDVDTGAHRSGSMRGDTTQFFTATADAADAVQALRADGFTVGTDDSVNRGPSGPVYHHVAFLVNSGADLDVANSVDDATPDEGDTVTFTVTVTNHGPATATGVEITAALPAGLTFSSATPSQGSYVSGTGVWTVGSVNAGVTATLTLAATVDSGTANGVLATTASVTAAALTDQNSGNDSQAASVAVNGIDLETTKTVDDANPNEGDTVTYTITLTNNGPNDASGVELTDALPTGVTFASATPSQGSYVSGTGVWTVGAISNGGSATLTLSATVDADTAASTINNTATVSASVEGDPVSGNDSDSAAILVKDADLAVTKTVSNLTPIDGEPITYIIHVENQGPDTTTGVELTDILPSGVTFASATPSKGSYSSGTGVWTIGALAVSENVILYLDATVDTGTGGQTIVNTAAVTASDVGDSTPSDDSDSASLTVKAADIDVSKTVDVATPNAGDTVTYTVTVSNNGPADATNLLVSDLLPAGLTFVSATPTQGSYANGTGVWNLATLASTASATLTLVASVDNGTAGSTITNTASVLSLDQGDPVSGNDSDSAPVTVQSADLALTKTVDDATPNEGQSITYTITVANNGPDSGTGIKVRDLLPLGVTFVSATPSLGSYNSTSGIWTVGTVASSAQETLSLVATVDIGTANTVITNSAFRHDADQEDPAGGNDSDSAAITVQSSDLEVTKTVDQATPNVGDTVTYTVTVSNNGPHSATGIEVTDLLPSGVTFASATPSQGSYVSGTGVWTVGTIGASGSATLTLAATVDSGSAGDTIVNTATVTALDQTDPVSSNDADSAAITVQSADLSLLKAVDDSLPNEGGTITYTITLDNDGPDQATSVEVTDVLPAGVTFVSAGASQGTYVNGTGVWTVGTVNASGQATLTIDVTVDSATAGTTIVNTASVTGVDQADPVTGDTSDTASITVQSADITVTKTVDDANPNEGDTVTYTVTISNNGPDNATSVVLTDLLPSGVTFTQATPSQGSYSGGTGVWTLGSILASASASLTLEATVDTGTFGTTIVNTATLTSIDQADPSPGDESDTASIVVQSADPSLTKTVSDGGPREGDTITYTLTVTNNGPESVTGLEVTDALPTGVTFVSATPSQGSYVSGTGVWTVGTIANAGNATLSIDATVDGSTAGTTITNIATITAADQGDSNAGNNTDSVPITVESIDLSMTKTVDDAGPNEGDTVTYTVTVANAGPDSATGVEVTDLLPAGVTFSSATPSQGSYVHGTGVWTVGTINASAQATLALAATVDASTGGTTITNTASVTASDVADTEPSNDSAGVDITVRSADLAMTKTVDDPVPDEGDTITYTVIVANAGPDDATAIEVTDLLPAGVTFVSATPSQGSYVDGTGVWSVGAISSSAQATLTIDATVDSGTAGTTIVNTATRTAADQADPAAGNDADSASITVRSADLGISKTVDDATPGEGATVTYTITLTNNGPDTATGVQVADLLPAGVTYVSETTTQGTYDRVTGIWTVGSVLNAGAATLTLTATADAGSGGSTIVNTASVLALDETDTVPANDSDSAPITVKAADLTVTKTVDQAGPDEGDTVTFTITVTNDGPSDTTGASLSDVLPAGLSFSSASPSQGTYSNGTGVWTVGALADTASATLTLVATVDVGTAGDTIVNTATATGSDLPDPTAGNDTDTASVTVISADLDVTMAVDDTTPGEGDTITYTVTLTNLGADEATGVEVTDLLPSGVTYVSDSPSQGSYVSGTGVWTVGTLADSATATLTLTATVDGGTLGTGITNTATVTGLDQGDPVPGNDSDSVLIAIEATDLGIVVAIDEGTTPETGTIHYTVLVTNHGPDDAAGIEVSDVLPAGVTYVAETESQGSYVHGTGVWSVGALVTGATATLDIEATVDGGTDGTTITNTATITALDNVDFDPSNDSDSVDLDVGGSMLVATGTYTGDGTDARALTGLGFAPDVVLIKGENTEAAVLRSASMVGDTSKSLGAAQAAGADRVESLDGDGFTVGTHASVNADGVTYRYTALRAASTELAYGTYTGDGSDDRSLSLPRFQPDWLVVMGEGPREAVQRFSTQSGDASLTFGAAAASSDLIQAFDTLGFEIGGDADVNANTETFHWLAVRAVTDRIAVGTYGGDGEDDRAIGTVGFRPDWLVVKSEDAGAAAHRSTSLIRDESMRFAAAADVADAIQAMAATGFEIGTDDSVNDGPSGPAYHYAALRSGEGTDVALDVAVSDARPTEGDAISYTVTAANHGEDGATGVIVQDLLPAGVTFVSATPSAGTYDSGSGDWDIGALAPAASETLTLAVTVDSGTGDTTITNTASVTALDQIDIHPGNGLADASIDVQIVDLVVTKTVDAATPTEGDTITYTIVVANAGPQDATAVAVTDLLPAGVSYVSDTPSQGTYASGSGVWSVGTVAAAGDATLTLVATVDGGTGSSTIINHAGVTAVDQVDTNPANDADSAAITVHVVDLSISKTVDDSSPRVGDSVTYTVTVANAGPFDATSVVVTDLLPSGVTYAADTPSQGSYTSGSGIWSVGTVSVSGSATLSLTATVDAGTAGTTIVNTATRTAGDQVDTDAGNDSAGASIDIEGVDIVVAKAVDDGLPDEGASVTWTITLNNLGPDTATGVEITDAIPSGLTYTTSSASQGGYSNGTGVWTVGSIADGGSATLQIVTGVNAGTSGDVITNTATLTAVDQTDANAASNTDSASITVQGTDLDVTKNMDDQNPEEGDTVTYTVDVTNLGPWDATGVQITDELPAGVSFASASATQGSYSQGTGIWSLGALADSATASLTITATVDVGTAASTITNTASLTAIDQLDTSAGNNTDSVSLMVIGADLALSISVNDEEPDEGQLITYTVIVTNNGPDDATGVEVTDLLPSGVTLSSGVATQGTYDPGTGVWSVGSLADGDSQSLFLGATVDTGTNGSRITNTATVTAADQADQDVTNNAAEVAIDIGGSDLSIAVTADTQTAVEGDSFTYTVTVNNLGPDTVTGVSIEALLPEGVTLVLALPEQGTFDAPTNTWDLGSINNGAVAALDLICDVDIGAAGVTLTAVAHPAAADRIDPDPSNDRAAASVRVPGFDCWFYQRPVQITHSGATLVDYPVRLILDTATLDSPYNHFKSDGSDIRFTDASRTEYLDFWIESWNPNGTSLIWVKIPSIPDGTSTVLLWTGREEAISASNGAETFLFFDDFDDDLPGRVAFDWTAGVGCGDAEVADDFGNQVFHDGTDTGGPVSAGDAGWTDVAVRQYFRALASTPGDDDVSMASVLIHHQDDDNMLAGGFVTETTADIRERVGGSWSVIGGPWAVADAGMDWHVQELRVAGSSIDLYIDDAFIGTTTRVAAPTSGRTGFWCQNGDMGDRDDHLVRPYVENEPTATLLPAASSLCGLYDPVASVFFLRNSHSAGPASATVRYGRGGSNLVPLIGDWDGDGVATMGLYDPSGGTFFLRNANSKGPADLRYRFGARNGGYVPLVGDWDGDGDDTIGLYSPTDGVFFLRDSHGSGGADHQFRYGPRNHGHIPLVGDWNSSGSDGIGLFLPSSGATFLRNTLSNGIAEISYSVGAHDGWLPLGGDWGGNGESTVGLYSPGAGRFELHDEHSGSACTIDFRFGPSGAGWIPLGGDWDPR